MVRSSLPMTLAARSGRCATRVRRQPACPQPQRPARSTAKTRSEYTRTRDRLPQDGPRRPISGLSPAIHSAGCPRVVPENGDGLVASSLVASVVGLSHCLKYKEKTRSWAAGTLLERTSKTCRDHAYSIVLATTVCPVCFSPHRLRLPRLTYAMATVRSFSMPENSQPV